MQWGEELGEELAGLGTQRNYPAGEWLPPGVRGVPVVRVLLSGEVDTHVMQTDCPLLVGRYGSGEVIGVRNCLYPELEPRLGWHTASPVRCLEIAWPHLVERSEQSSRLEGILQHLAQVSLYAMTIAIHPALSCLDPDSRDRLFEHAIVRLLAPGEQLIQKRGARAHLYLIISGSVDIRSDGRSVTSRGSGEILGEISLFGFSPEPTADVVAQSLTEIIEFRDDDMLIAMRDNPVFKQRITALIGSRIHL